MDRDAAYEIVFRHLTVQFELPPEKVRPEAGLFTDLELDSIDALDMVGYLETELGIRVVEEELQRLRVVEDVVQYVVRYARAPE